MPALISTQLQLLLWLIVGLIVCASFDKPLYKSLVYTQARQVGVFACALVFCVLWQIKAGILPGLELHILGVTGVTLILGWRLAILSALLASAVLAAFAQISLQQLPVHLLLSACLPIALSYGFFVISYHFLPRHFFIYIFVSCFLCAGLVSCVKIIAISTLYYFTGQYSGYELTENYISLCPIIWFPEAMLNGMAISVLITYRPHWVKTFYDKDYLDS